MTIGVVTLGFLAQQLPHAAPQALDNKKEPASSPGLPPLPPTTPKSASLVARPPAPEAPRRYLVPPTRDRAGGGTTGDEGGALLMIAGILVGFAILYGVTKK